MVLFALVAACTSPTAESPADGLQERVAVAALLPLVLTSDPWVGSLNVELRVTGAPANTRVYFLSSPDLTGPGACPAQTAPLCLEVSNPITVLGSDRSNASGVAVLSVPVANPPADPELEIQAVIIGAAAAKSNAEFVIVHSRTSDADNDGLTAEDEVATFGTDPDDEDSDGDNVDDGVEVAAGTDPLDSSDEPLTWDNDVFPLLSVECAGCHTGGGNSGGFNLDDYVDVVNEPSNDVPSMDRVEPFDANDSYLFHKLDNTQASVGGSGGRMPQGGPAFTASEKALVEDWINQGALE